MPGVGGSFIGPASHRGDPRKPHLTVDPLARTAEFCSEHVVETIQTQSRVFLVQLHQSPPQRLIAPLPYTWFVMFPVIVAAA